MQNESRFTTTNRLDHHKEDPPSLSAESDRIQHPQAEFRLLNRLYEQENNIMSFSTLRLENSSLSFKTLEGSLGLTEFDTCTDHDKECAREETPRKNSGDLIGLI